MPKTAKTLVAAITLAAVALGCAASGSQTVRPTAPDRLTMPEGTDQWLNELRAAIPVGMPIAEARALLTAEGFEVTHQYDGIFESYLVAKHAGRAGFLVSRHHSANVAFENDRVTKVGGSISYNGP